MGTNFCEFGFKLYPWIKFSQNSGKLLSSVSHQYLNITVHDQQENAISCLSDLQSGARYHFH